MIEISSIIIKISRLIIIITFSDLIMSQGHPYLDNFVSNHILLTKSKMEASPLVWQDLKEGFLRNYTIRFADIILDSLFSFFLKSKTQFINPSKVLNQ